MAASAQTTIEADFKKAFQMQNAGRFPEASQLYRRVLARDPDHALACHNLGIIIGTETGPAAALPLYWNAVRLMPNFPEAHNSLANAYQALNLYELAEKNFRIAIASDPSIALIYYNFGNLMMKLDRNEEAEKLYSQALRLDPNYKDACVNRGNVLRSLSRRAEAQAMFERSLEIDPGYALGHIGLGNILRDLDESERALVHYRAAVENGPDLAIAHFNYANVLRDLGQVPGAEASFRRAIELDPTNADYYRHLVQVARLKPDDLLVVAMQEGFESPTNTEWARMNFGYALGIVFDQARLHDQAFRYFAEANRLKRKTAKYDHEMELTKLAAIRKVFAPERLASLPTSGIDDETPIFVVGMMRSGTTLTEQILASHPDVAGAGESMLVQDIVNERAKKTGKRYPDFLEGVTAAELAGMGAGYLDQMRKRHGSAPRRIVDKMPQNFVYAGLIHLMLPKARFVWLQRDPMDTGFSIFSILFTQGHDYAYDLKDIGAYYRFSQDLREHWLKLFPERIHTLHYEALTENSEHEVRALLDFCGLDFDERCLNFHKTERIVRTASAIQVREGFNRRSIQRWKPYESHLRELKRALRDA
jgi:tetratricopeptide (TPR) repeat protein